MPRLRVVFFGSPPFAVPTLAAVLAAHDVVAVVTQPDKPAGRGQSVVAPAVKVAALAAGIPVLQPRSARTPELALELSRLAPDVAVVVAYGKILPQAVLDVPRDGCLNVHASLLPRYRGAAPIQWALLRGEARTGVTIMRLDAGMDTGPMLLRREVDIGPEDTSGTLHDRLGVLGAELMNEALARLHDGTLVDVPQDAEQATHAPMLTKDVGRLDWTRTDREIQHQIRAVDPWPGGSTQLGEDVLKVFRPHLTPGSGAPGEVLGVDREGLIVACGTGAVALGELQLPGKKRMPAQALAQGRPIPPGTRLGSGKA
jgi:methionyl-tRNA formyltransferase